MNLRLDRLATLYLASPYRRLLQRRQPCIPILMYHSISEAEQSEVHPYYRTTTSPAMFAAQLAFLKSEGYQTCTLAQALCQLETNGGNATKSVVLTFDDGFRNFYRSALPLLNQHGFSATVFLPTGYIGEAPIPFKGVDCLTWSEVRELKRQGIDFGSHTVTHPRLRELSFSAIQDELVNSKEMIEQRLGCRVESFSYPYAFPQADTDFIPMLRHLLETAGYNNGVSTVVGRASRDSEPLFLERLPVNSWDDARLFGAKLDGAYDWIAPAQRFSKRGKSHLQHQKSHSNLRISNELPWKDGPQP
jgi:peptidoglycan/xylan/chitin deacetylase (PgdA/CDA1 family)